jgi:energy-coupling factor transporter ATP-binding protein EcfA2
MRARAAGAAGAPAVGDVADAFGITPALHQPIRSLSGGETVKLAMAKSFIAAEYSRRLTIASPFSWLSANNRDSFFKLCARYQSLAIPVEVLALEEEDSTQAIDENDAFAPVSGPRVGFDLVMDRIRVRLGSFVHELHGREAHAEVADCRFRLGSPCLVVGENGQGKSLVAKILAGAVNFSGTARIETPAGLGRVRLLFQDVITQTLLRTFQDLASSTPQLTTASGMETYRRIIGHVTRVLAARGKPAPKGGKDGIRTLLEIKAMLIAIRLAASCRALILDEPDWGLNRASSVAFVSAAISAAHRLGVPVLLISHKPWWKSIAASILATERSGADADGTFQIRLHHQTEKAP